MDLLPSFVEDYLDPSPWYTKWYWWLGISAGGLAIYALLKPTKIIVIRR